VTGVEAYKHDTGQIAYELVATDDQGEKAFIGVLYRSALMPDTVTFTYAGSQYQLTL
jgi:hypothetical protein